MAYTYSGATDDDLKMEIDKLEAELAACQQRLDESMDNWDKLEKLADNRQRQRDGLAEEELIKIYKKGGGHAVFVAELCDNHLDRSGALLGRIRQAALDAAELTDEI
jgi:hypothetical protein